ncbi:MAG: cytidine deaminase, partial [Chthoniobacteraceae bacterium]
SFGLTICAERNAVAAAVAAGERRFRAVVIVADSKTPVSPCGACRQVLAEFGAEMEVHSVNLSGERFSARLSELLPRASEGILGT